MKGSEKRKGRIRRAGKKWARNEGDRFRLCKYAISD